MTLLNKDYAFDIFMLEMDDQVGLEDGTGTGVASDITSLGCPTRFFGGYKKNLKLKHDITGASKDEWRMGAEACIDRLKYVGYDFEIATLNMNGFSIEAVENED